MTGPRAIETLYRGHRFRSRLEARWAVFFDEMGWLWQYEPEGFDLPSGRYLPDFLVDDGPITGKPGLVWWEVKPDHEQLLAPGQLAFDPRWADLVRLSGQRLYVSFGMPGELGAWPLWEFANLDDGMLRLRPLGHYVSDKELPALRVARGARFEHRSTDATALR